MSKKRRGRKRIAREIRELDDIQMDVTVHQRLCATYYANALRWVLRQTPGGSPVTEVLGDLKESW